MSDIREVDRKLAEQIADRYGIGIGEIVINEERISKALAPEREASRALYDASKSIENDDCSIPAKIWNDLQLAIEAYEETK
jgi:hypothetical protein